MKNGCKKRETKVFFILSFFCQTRLSFSDNAVSRLTTTLAKPTYFLRTACLLKV